MNTYQLLVCTIISSFISAICTIAMLLWFIEGFLLSIAEIIILKIKKDNIKIIHEK